MKKFKKIMAVLVAAIMVVAMTVPAWATITNVTTPDGGFTVTITNHSTDHATHSYVAYQIFTGTLAKDDNGTTGESTDDKLILSDISWGSGIDSSELAALKIALTAIDSSFNSITFDTTQSSAVAVAKAIDNLNLTHDVTKAQQIAAAFDAALNTTTSGTGGATSVTGLNPGYYLIKDASAPSGTDGAYTRFILQMVESVTVEQKASVPSADKTVDNINDSTEVAASVSASDSADYDIGDDVPFHLKATTASTADDYVKYHITFNDTLQSGLKNNKDYSLTVNYSTTDSATGTLSFTSTEIATTGGTTKDVSIYDTTSGTAHHVNIKAEKAANDSDTGFSIKVTFENKTGQGTTNPEDRKLPSGINSKDITIDYTAKLLSTATAGGAGNTNTLSLNYSNNPNNTADTDEGTTPSDKTTVFTYKLNVNKTDNNDTPLAGATFTLYKLDKSGDSAYVWDSGKVVATSQVGNDYVATFNGLDDGIYKLSETVTPQGYNTADDVLFAIVATHTEDAVTSLVIKDVTLTESSGNITAATIGSTVLSSGNGATFTAASATGIIGTTIINNPGATLPTTGGMGTTVLYIVGGMLVILAGAYLFFSRKKTA